MMIVGDLLDVTGFRLAGVPGFVCVTEPEVRAAFESAAKVHDGVVIVSASVAALAPGVVAAARARRSGPLLLVLPGGEAGGPS